jgi:hypothetical protein
MDRKKKGGAVGFLALSDRKGRVSVKKDQKSRKIPEKFLILPLE